MTRGLGSLDWHIYAAQVLYECSDIAVYPCDFPYHILRWHRNICFSAKSSVRPRKRSYMKSAAQQGTSGELIRNQEFIRRPFNKSTQRRSQPNHGNTDHS